MEDSNLWARSEILTYLQYIYALLRPGHPVPVFNAHPLEPRAIDSWSIDEKKIIVDEGRRQLDRQAADLDQIRSRAQVIITTGIALGAATVALLGKVAGAPIDRGLLSFVLWSISLLVVLFSILGATAIVTVRADMGTINTTRLTFCDPPVLDELAMAYARTVRAGGNVISTRLALLRLSILLLLVAACMLAATWWIMSGL